MSSEQAQTRVPLRECLNCHIKAFTEKREEVLFFPGKSWCKKCIRGSRAIEAIAESPAVVRPARSKPGTGRKAPVESPVQETGNAVLKTAIDADTLETTIPREPTVIEALDHAVDRALAERERSVRAEARVHELEEEQIGHLETIEDLRKQVDDLKTEIENLKVSPAPARIPDRTKEKLSLLG